MAEKSNPSKPLEEWQVELMPYFEFVYIHAFSICENCSASASFSSLHKKYSDDWWFDEARAMKAQAWVVPETLHTFCGACAKTLGVAHNPNAYSLSEL